jgi:hypothetical protein
MLNVRPIIVVYGSQKERILGFNKSDFFGSKLMMGKRSGAPAISGAATPPLVQLFYSLGSSDLEVTIGHKGVKKRANIKSVTETCWGRLNTYRQICILASSALRSAPLSFNWFR